MNIPALSDTLFDLIRQQPNAGPGTAYLSREVEAYRSEPNTALFYRVFTAIPRFVGKQTLTVDKESAQRLNALRSGFSVEGWSVDRLARVWWLLQLPADDPTAYFSTVENLFRAAEMNELVALYSALPVLAYPEHWRFLATEAVRSNIGPVQEAIMLHNPYPAEQLDEPAWNQFIMKAFFTDKPVEHILGFHERANEHLARIVTDYARERRAAGRTVHPQLWPLVKPFASEADRTELEHLFNA
ncbi:EboA domain-containing protein [Larkinella soli]|uniref:EboA domain-containing protein n=1 Tax=Larkinella soli TaxID=1770527 RepID=UPI000FFB3B2B|nr:EboA domain-containing protein [Larkinella soli]